MKQLGIILAVLGLVAGCGSSDQPKLYPVSGKVSFEGSPLANASVTFMPESGLVAVGKTDASGQFSLKTRGMPGAVSGPFTVVITATDSSRKVTPEEWENLTDAERRKISKSVIPEKYGKPEESGLQATVEPKQQNEFTFDL